ncbi:amino acid ABC transporter substrate-binding protein [Candidatus Poriferisodalis sp.]|uniref:amino acid ABC transporter substrate-binding protein n=1 Tax=Candidatus Poriferisodalis sp. TaxID=3101277 RepID=UPI003C6ECF79
MNRRIAPISRRSALRLGGVLVALALMAAACGSGDGDDQDVDGDEPAATTEAAEPETEVALVQDTGDLLATVQDRGSLNCGVSGSAVAFSETQPDGSTTGFDADYCRAVAAAILGDAGAVNFVPLTAAERFTALETGDIDLLVRNTTWTQSRDTDLVLDFGPTTYYDGQQIMARVSDNFSGSSSVADLDGATVCTNAGTTTEKNIADAANAAGIEITLSTFEDFDIVTESFIQGACDAITTDGSALVGRKVKQEGDQEWVIFPPTPISKEPLGPVYPQNQSTFGDVVNWTVYATIIADEKGITSENIDSMLSGGSLDAEAIRMLGGEGELQTKMGLTADAFYNVISQVGNYDEIYTRNLGPVGLSRDGSANARWTAGGLIYAPPAR